MTFREILTENNKDIEKTIAKFVDEYGWGNYRFDIENGQEMTTSGFDVIDDNLDTPVTVTFYLDNKVAFTAVVTDFDKVSNVKIKDKKGTKALTHSVLNNKYTNARD